MRCWVRRRGSKGVQDLDDLDKRVVQCAVDHRELPVPIRLCSKTCRSRGLAYELVGQGRKRHCWSPPGLL